MMSRFGAMLFAVSLGLTVGCDDSKQKEEAARADAAKKAEEADKVTKEANAKAAAAKAEAAEAAAKAHTTARTAFQKDVDTIDRKVASLKEKAAKLTGPKKQNTDAAIAEYDKRKAALAMSMAKLSNDADASWEQNRIAVAADIEGLKKAGDSLESTIDGK